MLLKDRNPKSEISSKSKIVPVATPVRVVPTEVDISLNTGTNSANNPHTSTNVKQLPTDDHNVILVNNDDTSISNSEDLQSNAATKRVEPNQNPPQMIYKASNSYIMEVDSQPAESKPSNAEHHVEPSKIETRLETFDINCNTEDNSRNNPSASNPAFALKHLRVSGMHPYYRWPCHEQVINREIPTIPIRHVQRTLEQFARFDIKHYPSSKLTLKGKLDLAIYHPRYTGFEPKNMEDLDEQLNMSWIFYPPEGEEWYKTTQCDDAEIDLKSETVKQSGKVRANVEDPFRTDKMRPYLSPTRESRKTQPEYQENQRWGSYKGKTASSYDENRRQEKNKLVSRDAPLSSTITSAISTSHLRSDVTPPRLAPIATTEILPSTSTGSTGRYVIPKV